MKSPTDTPAVMVARIDELLGTRRYDWARDTLTGIRRTITESNTVTLRQQEAVEHIMLGRLKHDSSR